MGKREAVALTVLAVFLIAGFLTRMRTPENDHVATVDTVSSNTPEAIAPVIEHPYVSDVPKAAVMTKPTVEILPDTRSERSARTYAITASSLGYEPENIVVQKGDVITLELFARDGTYDLAIPGMGLYLLARMGGTKQVWFEATSQGTFAFACRDYCAGVRDMRGELVIVP